MKFYNPFKPHVIEVGGLFYVRKFSLSNSYFNSGWLYLVPNNGFHVDPSVSFDRLEYATVERDSCSPYKEKPKKLKVTVHH
jgi:hypothetical protein